MHDDALMTKEADCAGPVRWSGKRNRFFRFKQMRAEEFEIDHRYFIGRRRLINRTVLGWGVVHGFALKGLAQDGLAQGAPEADPALSLSVGPGFALDRYGREVVLDQPAIVGPENVFLLIQNEAGCQVRPLDKLELGRYVLSIHYAERRVGDARLPAGCGCARPEKKYICETAVFSLTRICNGDECPCAETGCDRSCNCDVSDSCGNASRGPHACLCHWLTDAEFPGDPPPLCEWNGYWINVEKGVGLACVSIAATGNKCKPVVVSRIDDACGPRRLVKNNDLLYDLSRGCDLTRISWISWASWHRAEIQVRWNDFAEMFQAGTAKDGNLTNFVIRFSAPVLTDTLRLDTVAVTIVIAEQATGWNMVRRVPIVAFDMTPDKDSLPPTGDLPSGTTNQIRLIVGARWFRDEVARDEESWLTGKEFTVEVEIRGDLILDCHRQPIDAEAIGLTPTPSGNGSPGGTFLSSFRVLEKPEEESR